METLRRALPAARCPPSEPFPVPLQCLLLRELLWTQESLTWAGPSCWPGLGQEFPLAVSTTPVPGAIPADQAGADTGSPEGGGRLLYQAGTDHEPEVVQSGGGCIPICQLSLAGLDLLPAVAFCFWVQQDTQSPAVAGQCQTGTAQCSGP